MSGGYKRASRKDNPKEVFRCDIGDCGQKFVRLDLLARHKKRHTSSYTPRNRVPSFEIVRDYTAPSNAEKENCSRTGPSRHSFGHHPVTSGPHDAAILLTPESNTDPTPTSLPHPRVASTKIQSQPSWRSRIHERAARASLVPHGQHFFGSEAPSLGEPAAIVAFQNVGYGNDDQLAQSNFAAWLFDPQTSCNDINVANLPFLEGGLESTFNSNIHYDYESLASLSPMDYASRHSDIPDDWITESRRRDLLFWFHIFRKKQPRYEGSMPNLVQESGGDLPALNLDMMRDCLKEFWDAVSPRLPIVHQHTFSPNRCPIFLLLVMISLGAASLRSRDTTGQLREYGAFADVIICSVRWEILTSEDSSPPVRLWAAQALLLVELYEKLYSTRRLHERAHIYHPAFLTLLRRGSPLIGRTGSESPEEPEDARPDRPTPTSGIVLDSKTWWIRWAKTESMHRVVFAAFMLDTIHAAMFGHAADMAAHEIRLPLPCDDNLWTASSPDVVRQLDANFRMYGVKQVSFLDGLKAALHGKEVKTHSFGRMIVICGLLSLGWHLSHHETHLKWLEIRGQSPETHDNRRKLLLNALCSWKEFFDVAMSDSVTDTPDHWPVPNGPINSASLLFHLAHISLHADIIDCQVYAGARRLLGRKVSTTDYTNAAKRMSSWAKQSSTRRAILHAFKLLYHALVDPHPRRRYTPYPDCPAVQYSIRNEMDPHRPWIMYYSVLAIWAFVQAVGRPPVSVWGGSPTGTERDNRGKPTRRTS
ncbi:Zinc finger, C2H2 type domain containing protein [Metarhizium album ARSEF 1941]|uniref:Zinc finger, C2H2 type domain containing protein n=1 Tax=Metarhizium album (strain ARSEF 1941) TaxID=1081103 RepID=A0A0B2WPS1_METAS|nr:Zinc finger, C2H2 type domain containing protein [Metarhizium album ARSEF 1941]KHN94985.1 Zinc finger, C2H2 type domain containing protein [Metarhizium album ARSEF 1941]